jgi:hypothetical protein
VVIVLVGYHAVAKGFAQRSKPSGPEKATQLERSATASFFGLSRHEHGCGPTRATPSSAVESPVANRVIFIVVGAALGFGYHRLVGCRSGACAITANP